MCARFLSNLVLLYIGRVYGPFSGCTVLMEVPPVSAQNKSLISDTDQVYPNPKTLALPHVILCTMVLPFLFSIKTWLLLLVWPLRYIHLY